MAASRRKYQIVAARLSRRIQSGDYHVHGLPAERDLALEVGVSHMTVRKAIQELLTAGLLSRQPNGRLAVRPAKKAGHLHSQIALLAPAWESNETSLWQISLAQMQARFHCSSRLVHYAHWDDAVILNTLRQFDGVFLLPLPEVLPSALMDRFLKTPKPLVVLSADWSQYGIRSLRLFPPVFVQRLLDHLAALGHRKIDCFNVQPSNPVVTDWIQQWRIWIAAHGLAGELFDEPVPSYTPTIPAAYENTARRIRAGKFNSTALLCVTETAAVGSMRAMVDHGIRPGHDVAICTIDGAMEAEYLTPSITALASPDPKPYLATCLEWMLGGEERSWQGPLLVQPADLQVVARESTIPAAERLGAGKSSPGKQR